MSPEDAPVNSNINRDGTFPFQQRAFIAISGETPNSGRN
jgi:hypothetical protein